MDNITAQFMDCWHTDPDNWDDDSEHTLWKEDIKEDLKKIEKEAIRNRGILQAYEDGRLLWTTFSGEEIPIQNMNAMHIYNCILHLRRKGKGDSIFTRILKTELDKRLKQNK